MGSNDETTMKVLLLLLSLGLASPRSPIAVPGGGYLDQDFSNPCTFGPCDCRLPGTILNWHNESRLEPGTTSTRLGVGMRARVHRIVPPGPSTLKMDGALSKLKTKTCGNVGV